MPTYAPQVAARDRWAIVAYMRALQLSQHATLPTCRRRSARTLGSGAMSEHARARSRCRPTTSSTAASALCSAPARSGLARSRGRRPRRSACSSSVPISSPICSSPASPSGSLGLVQPESTITGGPLGRGHPPRLRVGDAHAAARCSCSSCRLLLRPHRPLRVGPAGATSPDARSCSTSGSYLNVPFFVVRVGIYFAVWLVGRARYLVRWSREQDVTGDPGSRCAACSSSAAARSLLYALTDDLRVGRLGDVARAATGTRPSTAF